MTVLGAFLPLSLFSCLARLCLLGLRSVPSFVPQPVVVVVVLVVLVALLLPNSTTVAGSHRQWY